MAATLTLALVLGACRVGTTPEPPEAGRQLQPPPLRVAILEPGSLDPHQASTRSELFVIKQICDPLVGFDTQTAALKPAIAESWSISPDAKKVTFHLRAGVKFHNGRDVIAEDYVYSLSRLALPKTGAAQHYLVEKVAGYPEVRAGGSDRLSGVKASGPLTLEVELREPYAEFPAVLANPAAGAAVPKEAVESSEQAFSAKPVCAGPYELKKPLAPGEDIQLVRFGGYHAHNGGFSKGGAGYAEEVALRVAKDEAAAYDSLESGQVDVAPVRVADLPRASRIAGRLHGGPNGHLAYVGLPTKKPPYDNPKFRTALALTVDRNQIVTKLLAGSRQIPAGFLPPSAGPVALRSECGGAIGAGASQAAARDALAASGVNPAASTINVYLNSGGGHEKWLEKVLAEWKRGLSVEGALKPAEWEGYLDFLAEPGPDGPFRLAWAIRFPSPEALYDPLFSSGSLDNFTRYSSPEFDGLMVKARKTVDDDARANAYAEAGRVLCRDVPLIPMWFGRNHHAFGPTVTSARKERVDVFGDPIIRELRIRT